MRSRMLYYIQLILINTHIGQGITLKDCSDQISTQVVERVDNGAKYVRVLSFDHLSSVAFDSIPHEILFEKNKKLNFILYIINWMIDFLKDRKVRAR